MAETSDNNGPGDSHDIGPPEVRSSIPRAHLYQVCNVTMFSRLDCPAWTSRRWWRTGSTRSRARPLLRVTGRQGRWWHHKYNTGRGFRKQNTTIPSQAPQHNKKFQRSVTECFQPASDRCFVDQTADETYLRTGPGSPGYTRASPRSPGPGTASASAGTSGTGSGAGNCSGSRAGKRKSRDPSVTPGVPGSSGSSNSVSSASNPKNTRCKRPKVGHSNWENPPVNCLHPLVEEEQGPNIYNEVFCPFPRHSDFLSIESFHFK